ncbi:hypothetical protein ACP70R_029074 [Stipagrostis hirtigluma subsp. patula]
MESTSGGSPDDEAGGSSEANGCDNHNAIDAPPSWQRQRSSFSVTRRSLRSAATRWGGPCTLSGSAAPGSSHEKRKGAAEEGGHGVLKRMKISASTSPASNRTSGSSLGSKDSGKEQTSERGIARGISSNKRKLMNVKSYIALFKPSNKAQTTDVVVKSAKQLSAPTKSKKVKESPFQKLQRLPDDCHRDFDNDHLYSVNELREFWHKSQGAVFVDDKEHVMKTILFILSVLPDVSQPFLLVTSASLPLWEAEFNRFAPYINVIVYDGEKDVQKIFQNAEFHETGSHVTSHILLAHPDAISKDIETVNCIDWEAVIVEYCQNSILNNLKHLTRISTDFRMVLLTSPLQDNLLEYKSLLAFLNSEEEDNGDYVDDDALAMLKARLTRHVAYERKAGSSKFLEHWVPANLSQVQLKLYCSILLANSTTLQSQIATDSVGALRDIMLCLWKCCNHPCLVDEFMQHLQANIGDVIESIDNRMRASGKLLLLEKMLEEIRNKRLRVIVLFQSDEAGGDPMGDILEKFVRHKFGPESCERVQYRSTYLRKQEAMSMFNDRTKGRFVFLIENRACLPSIKLSSIDAIIIYDSDWNPLNDLKALQKIKIQSQLTSVSIFRLYTPFTLEEKSLMLAKQGIIVDGNSQDIIPSLSHCLLSWGVSLLFSRLDELQQDNSSSKENDTIFMDKVISEFLAELSTEVEGSTKVNSTTISKAYMSGEFYSRNITVIGERKEVSSLDGDPPQFWLSLLDGKSPCWPDMSELSQVSNINLQIIEKPTEVPTEETKEAGGNRRKTGEIGGSSSNLLSDTSNKDRFPEISTSSGADLQLIGDTQKELGVENLSTPKSLHPQLKCELSKLTKVLKLPDNVQLLAEQFLEYLLKNHLVIQQPPGLLHALNIALCWCAASHLKYNKLDRRASLSLAAECLNYECTEELARLFYEKLGTIKEKVLRKAGERGNNIENGGSSSLESSFAKRNEHMLPEQAMDLHGNFTNGTPRESSSGAAQMVSDRQELVSAPQTDREWHLSSEEPPNLMGKRIDLVKCVFSLREKDIHEKQQLELLELRTHRENQVIKLKEVCSLVVQHIRRSEIDEETRNDQIKLIIQWFTMLLYAFLEHMRLQLDKLEALHSMAFDKEQLLKEKLKAEEISGQLDKFHDHIPDSGFCIEEFIHFKKQSVDYHVDQSLASGYEQLLDDRSIMEITFARNAVPSEVFSTSEVRNEHAEALVGSVGAAASEAVDLPEKNIHCSSDVIGLQRACCSSTIPASHDSTNKDSSDDCRSIEHANKDNMNNSSMLLGGATSLVMEIDGNNDGTVAADPLLLESPILASPQILSALSMSREVGTEANQSNMSALQHPPAEVEPIDVLQQTEKQTSASTLDIPPQRMYPDDLGQVSIEPNTTTGLVQEGTSSCHLGDVRMGVQVKNVASDPLNSGKQSHIGLHDPAILPNAREVETQTDQSGISAQQSSSPPAQQTLATLRHPPAEAELSSNLGTEAAGNLQPEVPSSNSVLDAGRSQTGRQLEKTYGLPQQGQSESLTFATPQRPAMLPFSSEVGPHANISSMSSQQSTDAPLRCPPAVAETTGTLETQDEHDFHSEMRPSATLLDAPLEMTQPDDNNQTGCRLDRATDLSDGGETEHTTCTTHNLTALTLPMEVETENNEAIMPRSQSTGPDAQQSLATSQHAPEEAEPAGIQGLMTADDLQRSTMMLGETTEAEPPVTLGATEAGVLQSELQLANRTQDVPLERTNVSGISVPQNMTLQRSFEPTCDTHVGAEPADVVAHSQSEIQPSSSLQDQHESERAGVPGTMAARELQSETQPLTSVQHMSPERTHPGERIQIGVLPNVTAGPEQLTELFQVAPAAYNHFISSSDPLKNELERLKYCKSFIDKNHEQKRLLLQTEWKQEMEKVTKKYESLLQKEDATYHRMTMELDDFYRRVYVQHSLAENFREKFVKHYPVQESSVNPTTGQAPQSSQEAPARTSGAQTTTSPAASSASSLGTQPPMMISFGSTGPFPQPSQVALASAAEAIQLQPVLPRNVYRATSPLSSMPLQNGSYRAAGAQPRGPAPNVQQLRMPSPYVAFRRDQQQLPVVSRGITSLIHSASGILGNPLAGVAVTSMALSSVHPTMTAAPNSHPAPPSSSMLPGSLPGLGANFVQSYTNPVPAPPAAGIWHAGAHITGINHLVPEAPPAAGIWRPGAHIAGVNHPVPEAPAAAGIWRPGAHIAGVNHPVPEVPALEALLAQQWYAAMAAAAVNPMASSSNHRAMTAPSSSHQAPRASSAPPGPPPAAGSGPAGTGAVREVVCLSDDEG